MPAAALVGPLEAEIRDLTCDSREAGPGWAFVALKGEKADGVAFVPQVLQQGVSAVLSESPVSLPEDIAGARLLGGRFAMGRLARRLFGAPDERLALIGVTGTNGKTTTTTLIRQLLRASGVGCGLVGTVLNAAGEVEEEAVRTTPESPTFYRWLQRSVAARDGAAAVEVSSIGVEMGRIAEARFKVGTFLNLTQDHLDFHGSMEAYFTAKEKFFEQCDRILVNADDPYGRRLLADWSAAASFAVEGEADYRAENIVLSSLGTRFQLRTGQGVFPIESPLLGGFNVSNLLAALASCAEAGFDLGSLLPAVAQVKGAPGRLERVDCGQGFGVMVDYAHSPDALQKLLIEGKRLLPPGGRLHVLFGCGGDRDRSKRPLMAAAVAEGADVIWHSSDNPRGEAPERILDDAAPGIPEVLRRDSARYHRLADRREAVRRALQDCRPGDLLLLAGKGHEPYQEIQGVKHPYSDRGEVEAVLTGGGA
jgi:UDP-N-acetylmuramoyl-L-alanyl-D-glutamate--2,6-diaminopimelate ligase